MGMLLGVLCSYREVIMTGAIPALIRETTVKIGAGQGKASIPVRQ
jgi:hypothetical protein